LSCIVLGKLVFNI